MMFRSIIFSLLLLVATTALGQFHVPTEMTYQGILTDGNGTPLADGDYQLTVRIYNNATSTQPPVWENTGTVSVESGVFTTLLNLWSGLNGDSEFFYQELWLSLEVDGGGEMLPRTRLTTVPYAFMAGDVADNAVVRSINGLDEYLSLTAGPGIEITPNGDDEIIISSTDGGGGGPGVWRLEGDTIVPNVPFQVQFGPGTILVQDLNQGTSFIQLEGHRNNNYGATVALYGETGLPGVELHGQRNAGNNGGLAQFYDDSANVTLRIEAQNRLGAEEGSTVSMHHHNGTRTILMEAQEDGLATQGGMIRLYDENGTATVELDGDYGGRGRVITGELEITGGADLSEQFDIASIGQGVQPGHVVCIDPDRPGELKLSSKAYDTRVAGVVSGAGGVRPGMLMGQRGTEADGAHPVALTGRVYVQVDATGGAVEPGDLLTTSDVPGHAMKVGAPGLAQGAILGKAMTGLEGGRGLVLILVTLQ